jgi:hypothetical protein
VFRVFKLGTVLSVVVSLLAHAKVLAHGTLPVIPLHAHAAISLHSAGTLLRVPGISGASSAYLAQTKLITVAGVNIGVNQAVQNAFTGQIASGQLTGTIYESMNGNNPFFATTKFVGAFGNNPFFTNGGPPTGPGPSSFANSISFVGGVPKVKFAVAGGTPFALSASALRSQNQLNLIAKNAVFGGRQFGNALVSSPITAGNFFGTSYVAFGSPTFNKNGAFDFAFGNNPLNIGGAGGPATIPISSLTNYIQLANGRVFNFSAGLIPLSGYRTNGSFDSNQILSIGKDRFNFFGNLAAGPSSITYSALLKPYLTRF